MHDSTNKSFSLPPSGPMYQLHPSSISVEEEKRIPGGQTATLPLLIRAEQPSMPVHSLDHAPARPQKVSALPLPGASVAAPGTASHPVHRYSVIPAVPRREAPTQPVLSGSTRGRADTTAEHFLVWLLYAFLRTPHSQDAVRCRRRLRFLGTCCLPRDPSPKAWRTIPSRLHECQPRALKPCHITSPCTVPYGNLLTGDLVTLTLRSAHA